ncbi:MAG: FAD-binding oxidoreductase, partial [Sphingomonadales bacterium]|nr:FAD-binding oxidoreductase [Sphingomonadales bacterium]
MTALAPVDSDIIARLQSILGPENVITDDVERRYFAEDVYTAGTPPLAVLRPGTVDELAQAVAAATEAGLAVFPRGGGMSYTSGYLPTTPQSVTVDLLRMNKVREINLDDMYVTVECGCSWADLHEALKDHGVRPPFWGSLSGIHATVGGGLSQNAAFFGTGQYGSAADSVIGLEVVLADGRA